MIHVHHQRNNNHNKNNNHKNNNSNKIITLIYIIQIKILICQVKNLA